MSFINHMLKTKWPIIQGGMGNISNAQLTAAVSEAGGLGTLGCGTLPPDTVEAMMMQTKEMTDKSFAVNIPINVTSHTDTLIDLVIQHHIPVVSLSAGNPASIIPRLKNAGIKVLVVVSSVKHAVKAEAAGADALVAEGFEAAGINSPLELTTFTLIPQVVKHVRVPVVAAGGIGDGKGLAAALALGASGVQIGTRLIATKEAPFHADYKQKILEAEGTDAIVVGRSLGKPRRVLDTPYTRQLNASEKENLTLEHYENITSEAFHLKGALEGNGEQGFMNSGQVAGLIDAIPSVHELFYEMMQAAKNQLSSLTSQFENIAHNKSDEASLS
ncbi:NAD(P)H-dependent flavin oxidoreductase [Lentibacillus saliphilus]|uniref:NAD(P)H-dependent flavin oxidoreductase n=1 Tax=Lentibacillus saliphilus TaxID=2737028 RepID=UPI001C30DA40|nr:nitronate monooxygenase family protein [Lentibacillus saliphilus]